MQDSQIRRRHWSTHRRRREKSGVPNFTKMEPSPPTKRHREQKKPRRLVAGTVTNTDEDEEEPGEIIAKRSRHPRLSNSHQNNDETRTRSRGEAPPQQPPRAAPALASAPPGPASRRTAPSRRTAAPGPGGQRQHRSATTAIASSTKSSAWIDPEDQNPLHPDAGSDSKQRERQPQKKDGHLFHPSPNGVDVSFSPAQPSFAAGARRKAKTGPPSSVTREDADTNAGAVTGEAEETNPR
ncbi:serine/arginine repetitive matrix protein 1-like [Panicum virgatum]|uniref:serine/arginine repetitive matrix protein 1-like n=1 Tax=Panicum virgatum TaxID=38727 RepID=UPI0019D59910|nr:serine/arginine repetitive matrix protein 1-like [Panicum virgatum]